MAFALTGHDGGGKTSVQHEIVLGCMSLGVVIDGGMGPDLVQGDLAIMRDHRMGQSGLNCHIFRHSEDVSLSVGHCLVGKCHQEDLKVVGFKSKWFLCQWLDACPP